MPSNTLRQNFSYLKVVHILHSRYHPKIIVHILKNKQIVHILKNKQKNKYICIHEIIQSIIMKMKIKMKNRPHRYDIDRPRSRRGQEYRKRLAFAYMY